MSEVTWEELNKLPCKYFTVPIVRGNGEIILAPSAHSPTTTDYSLIKYNPDTDSCQEWIKYSESFYSTNNTDAIDAERDIIYIPELSNLLQIDLKSGKSQLIEQKLVTRRGDPTSIIIDHKLHIFSQDEHIIYDPDLQTKKVKLIRFNDNFDGTFSGHSMVHLKSQNKLLFIGGRLKKIIIWDIINDKWSILKGLEIVNSSGYSRYRAGVIMTRDEKYAIIFGGQRCDMIDIFDINKRVVYQSNIKCPQEREYRAMLTDNVEKNNVIIHGYLKNVWKNKEFNNLDQLPLELIILITTFYANEYVHLMRLNGEHWRMSLSELLHSKSDPKNR